VTAPQGSEAWLSERAGHATASRFKDILATIKTGEAASRRNYRIQLVTERLTGVPCESYTNAAMQWGTEQEPYARDAYEAYTGDLVEQVGFLKHPGLAWTGASPDGLVGKLGGVEIKCPHQSTVHVETIHGGMPAEHMAQVQGAMWVTDRQWWDFVSFDPRMPEKLRLYVQRIERDPKYIERLMTSISGFLAEVDAMHKQLLERA
jgi:putative phage-type endonuclease